MSAVFLALAAIGTLCCAVVVSRLRARQAEHEWAGDLEADTFISELTSPLPLVPPMPEPVTVHLITSIGDPEPEPEPLYVRIDDTYIFTDAHNGISDVRSRYDSMQEMFAKWGWEDLPSFTESSTLALPRG